MTEKNKQKWNEILKFAVTVLTALLGALVHTSLHGYFFIKLQLHFHTTMNQYVNKSIRQRIIEASKKRPFSTKGISPSIELQDNVCFLFCSVQSLDDGITKLCRTIRV